MTKNRKEEQGDSCSPEADVHRVLMACGTNPSGEILVEPLTIFQERQSLVSEMHRPWSASFGADEVGSGSHPPSPGGTLPSERQAREDGGGRPPRQL